jgi:hypothetical protein
MNIFKKRLCNKYLKNTQYAYAHFSHKNGGKVHLGYERKAVVLYYNYFATIFRKVTKS